ncbi:MAG: calcium-binding protein, partial [Bacteroidetes bacterium]|nr:calcium-binding protein [Bacteroidota bacterium]
VDANTSADIHWLIIPAPGASNGLEQGTLYYVGATLSYTIGGEENVTEVSPDYIFVKPMPELTLDYFLPNDVYGDDAFTPEIEPSVPFSLGVRVLNSGDGTAKDLKIDSAQPEITENEQGLLIGFVIEGSEVNGQPATPSLLADFGDIESNTAGMARWIMTCSLSGQFVDIEATYSHSDELGGELTSLLEGINTHFLVRDVLVDLPGRDNIRDFLALDGGVYRVYESTG